jgi:hypothetical protein
LFNVRPSPSPLFHPLPRGRVADGIDEGRVSGNSGAEANIVAAEALFSDAVALARDLEDPLDGR